MEGLFLTLSGILVAGCLICWAFGYACGRADEREKWKAKKGE